MLEVVRRTLQQFNMIAPGDRVVAGVSGGADSVALLLTLCEYREEMNFTLDVVHINHLIREDAGQDAEFVKALCNDRGISFHYYEIDVEDEAKKLHMSTEEAGRKYRYDAMRSLKPDKIAVGHHSDDLTETVILNLCRGTGIHGMAGIAPVTDDIIRPFLYVTRADIEKYLSDLCQPYRTDSTNLSTDYTRNKIRLNVLPYLNAEINDKTSLHIANLSQDMLELEELIDSLTCKAINSICKENMEQHEIVIDQNGLHNLDDYIKREVILKALEKLTPKRKDITRSHVSAILDITAKSGEKRVSLPYNLEAVSSYETLIIRQKSGNLDCDTSRLTEGITLSILADSQSEFEPVILPDGRTLSAHILPYEGKKEYPDDRCTKWLDYDKIKRSVVLRFRRTGDYLTVNDSLKRKSVKDYMINEKIPRQKRDNMPLLADGDHIIWLIDYRISAYYKVSEATRNILEVNIK